MNSEPLLQANGIEKSYGHKAVLHNISFSLHSGKSLCLFGPNGSGKSTLLDILALAIKPAKGRILFFGIDALLRPQDVRASIGYVPQDIALFFELTVRENLLCWSRKRGREALADCESIMTALGLHPISRKRIRELSGGMKRRVNLAVALLDSPKLLVLDEPFANVDAENTMSMLTLLEKKKAEGTAILISDHSALRLLPLMDTAMVLHEGEAVFFGGREALLRHGSDADAAILNIVKGAAS
jgi:ABC-2 type transport system ATP-binding protein